MFQPVNSKVSFSQLEEKILKFWKERDVFKRSVEERQGAPRFVLYEGPPTANGSPGIHHVLSRVYKDVIPRYKAMKGYYAPRIGGWDTHGLPVELEVEKELGFSSKAQIEEYGVDRFNDRCRESVFGYLKEWEAVTERIAFWVDLDNAYVTMRNEYIETIWWALKQMWDKGLIYQGYKVTPHCPRCGTSLSSHEVALGYRDDTEDPSVYIKFKLVLSSLEGSKAREPLLNLFKSSNKPAYFLAWTTTPWTLPANTALAVAADAEYAIVDAGDEYIIIADALLESAGLDRNRVTERVWGNDLVGAGYEPLFSPKDYDIEVRSFLRTGEQGSAELQLVDSPSRYPVIATDFVSMEEGTGIVHIAPSYGEVDYEAGQTYGLHFVHVVDLQGNMIGSYPFSGKFVKDADPEVLGELDKKGLLYRSETIRHTYPFCWRCEAPLVYYAKQTWYIKTTAVKEALIAGNNEINWYPEHIKYGRFGDWLENNVDWAFSRERYWGTPLPVWRCEDCGGYDCISGTEELGGKVGFSGFKEPLDLHRPFVDELSYHCPECGGQMRRVPEVIDVWFDSGAMPIAQYHYPFENGSLLEDGRFPADYISEAVDQTRGWFYSLHAISTLLFDRPCFKNVICLGLILDAKREKMSKARGNVVEPWAVINKYGADALRWCLLTGAPPGNVRSFSEDILTEVTRRFLLTLWNVYSFFVTYAGIDRFAPDPSQTPSETPELDRWIVSELNQLVFDVDAALDSYNPTEAGRRIENFVDGLSNWYVRRSRRRFWKSENDADKLSAYNTLYQCLVTLSKLLAPFTPFLAEELYQNLVCGVSSEAADSVHLADFPVADEGKIDRQLMTDMQFAMKVSSLGRAARSKAGIKVRQPVATNIVGVSSDREKAVLERVKPLLLEELNVKEIKSDSMEKVAALEGPDYVVAGEAAINSAIQTFIPEELEKEGMAREIVHRLQIMRRSAGFDIADYIVTYYQSESYLSQVIEKFADYIKQETLSEQLRAGAPGEGSFSEGHKFGGHDILLGVKRV